jgi:hypothetical protein
LQQRQEHAPHYIGKRLAPFVSRLVLARAGARIEAMTTMRTFICPTCGATLATSAEPGTTITCEYCSSPFMVPAPSLDQPGDSQATVVASFRRRGDPSPMPPTGPDGTPPSTPDLPPDPNSPAGVGNTVDSDAVQPMVERGPVGPESVPVAASEAPPPAAAPAEPLAAPEPVAEQPAPQIIEDLDRGAQPPAEPEPPVPPTADPRASDMTVIAPSRVRAALDAELQAAKDKAAAEAAAALASQPAAPPGEPPPPVPNAPSPIDATVLRMPEGASVADIIAEPTKYGAAVPSQQGEAVVTGPGEVKVVPPQTPAVGGPPGAAMRSGNNRMPLMIGGALVAVCCLLLACAAAFAIVQNFLNLGS